MSNFGTIKLPPLAPSLPPEACPPLDVGTVLQASSRVLYCEFQGRALVLNREGKVFFGLNSQAARLWMALQVARRVGELPPRAVKPGDPAPKWTVLVPWLQKMVGFGLFDVDPNPIGPGARRMPMQQLQRVAYAHRLASRPSAQEGEDEDLSYTQLPLRIE